MKYLTEVQGVTLDYRHSLDANLLFCLLWSLAVVEGIAHTKVYFDETEDSDYLEPMLRKERKEAVMRDSRDDRYLGQALRA